MVTMATLAVAAPAHADEIPTIIVGELGPDRELPLGSNFYLKVPTKGEVDAVVGAFVRAANLPFGARGGVTCADVAKQLGELRPAANDTDTMKIEKQPAGRFVTNEVWTGASHEYQAYMLGASEKQEDGKGFELLVPETPFFRPGAHYCLVLYKKERKAVDPAALTSALSTLSEQWACPGKDKPAELSKCQEDALGAFSRAVDHRYNRIDGEAIEEVKGAIGKLVSIAANVGGIKSKVRGLLNGWGVEVPSTLYAEPLVPSNTAFGGMMLAVDIKKDGKVIEPANPLASMTFALLQKNNELRLETSGGERPAGTRAYEYYRPVDSGAEAKRVRYVQFKRDFKSIEVAEDLTGKTHLPPIKLDLGTLTLPGSSLSLLDLLELGRGRVAISSGKYAPIAKLHESLLGRALEARSLERGKLPEFPVGSDDFRNLGALTAHIDELRHVMEIGLKASEASTSVGTDHFVYAQLGRWLKTLLQSCEKIQDAEWKTHTITEGNEVKRVSSCREKAGDGAAPWPGFLNDEHGEHDPLNVLNSNLRTLINNAELWNANVKIVQSAKQKPGFESKATWVSARVALTKDTWIGHYVTPVIGGAVLMNAKDPFLVQYAGVQIFFWPNPADEPMWTNGAREDFLRFFSIEAGLGLATESFGPAGRYHGIAGGSLPPLFLGLGLQPLPYTSVSMGMAVLSAKQTTLPQESPAAFASLYLSASLQGNIPDLIAAALGKARQSTTTGFVAK
ncbi:hypothetical protein BE21_26100 [Sorangium cellulosum]|uniref:Uncharacterized protein n=1 Tax=Sorangium cellulosum TaxID=56 RepID=A0A150TTH8_SORCE|nr:hypothetical protein BE21_26100 [Sorangium cellulosum]